MRNYAIVGLMAALVLTGFSAHASTNFLATQGLQQSYNWQQEWGGINFKGGIDPGIPSADLQPKKDIKTTVSQDGTQTNNLSGIKTYSVDLNGDAISDIIADASGYFPKYQKAGAPLTVCTTADGCYISVYLFGQNTSLTSDPSSSGTTTYYNTRTIRTEQVLGWNVIAASDFQTWAAGRDYQLFNTNPVLVELRNNTNCYQDEIAQNNSECVKYSQYVGDFASGVLTDLYNYHDLGTQPQYDTRFTYVPYERDAGVLARGMVKGGGFGHELTSGGTIDIQIRNMDTSELKSAQNFKVTLPTPNPPNVSNAYGFHIANSSNQSLFVPANSDKEFSSFINAVTSKQLSGVSVCMPPVQYTDWCGDLNCPTNLTTSKTIAAQRFCVSSTSDYRPCSECYNAAKAAHGVGWPQDWDKGCSITQNCAPTGCVEWDGPIMNDEQCMSVMSNYFAKEPADISSGTLNSISQADYASDPTGSTWAWFSNLYNSLYTEAEPAWRGGSRPSQNDIVSWCGAAYAMICQVGHMCLAGDTMITLPDSTTQRIDTLKVGETVLGFATPKGRLKPFKVTTIATTPKQDLLKINGTLSLTPNHRVIVDGGKELRASRLKVGDVLLAGDRSKVKITTIETVSAGDTVYNLVLDKPGIGFVANGIRVTDYRH